MIDRPGVEGGGGSGREVEKGKEINSCQGEPSGFIFLKKGVENFNQMNKISAEAGTV